MAFDGSLTSACLQLITQVKLLEQLLDAKHAELKILIYQQQALKLQHSQCEQDTEAMITPSPCNTEKSNTGQFTALLRRSWRLKQALDKYHTSVLRLEKQIIRLESRIKTSLALKASLMIALKTGAGKMSLQAGIEVMLAKNQLMLGQYD